MIRPNYKLNRKRSAMGEYSTCRSKDYRSSFVVRLSILPRAAASLLNLGMQISAHIEGLSMKTSVSRRSASSGRRRHQFSGLSAWLPWSLGWWPPPKVAPSFPNVMPITASREAISSTSGKKIGGQCPPRNPSRDLVGNAVEETRCAYWVAVDTWTAIRLTGSGTPARQTCWIR